MRWNATAVLPPRVPAGHLPIRCKASNGARANWMRRYSASGGFEALSSRYSPSDSGKYPVRSTCGQAALAPTASAR